MHTIRAKKSLGQNFLKDERVLAEIVRIAEVSKEDWVFEIGPGTGALTKPLTESAGQVLGLELDHRMIDRLHALCEETRNLCILEGNVLEMNVAETLSAHGFNEHGYKVVANIPYYITAPIIKMLLSLPNTPKVIVLLVQEEVADRLVAAAGAMSILSVMAQYYADVSKELVVPKESFDPMPEVSSAVVRLRPKRQYSAEEDRKLFRVVRAGFAARRKTLVNNLSSSFGLSREALETYLQSIGIRPDVRAQALSVTEWETLSSWISTQLK